MDTEILTSSGRPEASDPEVGFGFYRPASASGVAAETGHSQAFTTAAQTGLTVQEAQTGVSSEGSVGYGDGGGITTVRDEPGQEQVA